VLKKASHNKDAVPDVRADDSEHAMDHFNEGLRRVLAADKAVIVKKRTRRRKRRS
jgi:hypothetical protein